MGGRYDLIIVGTGPGGGTLAWSLRGSGARILLVERGDFVPQEPENWMPEVARTGRYRRVDEKLRLNERTEFPAPAQYHVGGMTKIYGATLMRLRERDFAAHEYPWGLSPAWPFGYRELEPYYQRAEELFLVHGRRGEDPTEGWRSAEFPYPAVEHEPFVARFLEQARGRGLVPFHVPTGIDLRSDGRCVRCATCDGFPCQRGAKADADERCVRPALEDPNITLFTNTFARRLVTDESGRRVVALEVERGGERLRLEADTFVISCGALHSPALLFRSASDQHPNGLANRSGLVGRNLMAKTVTFGSAIFGDETGLVYPKTWAFNDHYLPSDDPRRPHGSFQSTGGRHPVDFRLLWGLDPVAAEAAARRSLDFAVFSECLPDRENRVVVDDDGRLHLHFRRGELGPHEALFRLATEVVRDAGAHTIYDTLELTQRMTMLPTAHICGTLKLGTDPATSVLDVDCRTHDVDNLYAVDASFFPSQGAANPTLTIVANALRVGDLLRTRLARG